MYLFFLNVSKIIPMNKMSQQAKLLAHHKRIKCKLTSLHFILLWWANKAKLNILSLQKIKNFYHKRIKCKLRRVYKSGLTNLEA